MFASVCFPSTRSVFVVVSRQWVPGVVILAHFVSFLLVALVSEVYVKSVDMTLNRLG